MNKNYSDKIGHLQYVVENDIIHKSTVYNIYILVHLCTPVQNIVSQYIVF